MVTISFRKNKSSLVVAKGSNLMQALHQASVPVGSSCDGEGICGKCALLIVEGSAGLSAFSERELALKDEHQLTEKKRLSCQITVDTDLKIDADYW